jgi:hypothetical protein
MAKKPQAGGRGGALLQELKLVAERIGIRVREEKLFREVGYQVRGGGCRVRGQEIVFLDRDMPVPDRMDILLDELSRREVDRESLSPALRRLWPSGAPQ